MPSASKAKSKERAVPKAGKEHLKVSLKPTVPPSSGSNGSLASAYNPISGTFHSLDQTESPLLHVIQNNSQFKSIDDMEEHSGSSNGTGEFDCSSNNGSCSEESDDPKEKVMSSAPRAESQSINESEKREKNRQKNEKKHQRQKERRAQELHERCKGYLMSRKLDILSQQLVTMGFSSEQATMALIQNEGRLEESVTWLFEVGEESRQLSTDLQKCTNLKIDIAEELLRVGNLETKFRCTKQEVERAVVACEGDLGKAEESLKAQKQESTAATKSEEMLDSISLIDKATALSNNSVSRSQLKGVHPLGTQQPRREEKDYNYTKPQLNGTPVLDETLQPLRARLKPDLVKQLLATRQDKVRPDVNYAGSTAMPAAALQTKLEIQQHVMANNEVKNVIMNTGALREPIIMMQRSPLANAKASISSTNHSMSASPPSYNHWYSNGGVSNMGPKALNGNLASSTSSIGFNRPVSAKQFNPQGHQNFVSNPMELASVGWSTGVSGSSTGTSPSSLATPASLGLFKRWSSASSALPSSDWSLSGPKQLDYTSIDWSVDTRMLGPMAKVEWLSNTWSTMFMSGKMTRSSSNGAGSTYLSSLSGGGLPIGSTPAGGSCDWPSFAWDDLLWAPRNTLASPSL